MGVTSHQSPDLGLNIEIKERQADILVSFTGESKSKSPGDFLNPILQDILKLAKVGEKSIILDFNALKYMNSSTVAPLIKYWSTVKETGARLVVEYDGSIKWQKTNFSALAVFATESDKFELRDSCDA